MEIITLSIIAVLCFGATTVCRRWRDKDVLILVAIGCAINANIYNGNVMPINIGEFSTGIDSILYTLFMFTIVIMAKEYSVKEAKNMTLTTIAAIMISAFIQFFAYWSFYGMSIDILISLTSFAVSSISTFIAVWIMLCIYEKLQNKNTNIYLNFAVIILVASLINSFIYFGSMALIQGKLETNFLSTLIGSYIGKLSCIIIGLICYFINKKWWQPKSIQNNQINDNNSSDLDKKQ